MERSQLILNEAFSLLKQQNPRLSLRAIAIRLKISPSYLSKIMKGAKKIPAKHFARFAKAFRLDPIQSKQLQEEIMDNYVVKPLEKSGAPYLVESQNKDARTQDAEYRKLTQPDYWLLKKWFYSAIAVLATTEDFVYDAIWISQRIPISSDEAQEALELLEQNGFFRTDGEGIRSVDFSKIRFPTSRTWPQVREFHQQMISRAQVQLKTATSDEAFEKRLITGLTIAVDPKKIEKAKTLFLESVYKIANDLSESNCREVYQVNLQFFPLSHPLKGR